MYVLVPLAKIVRMTEAGVTSISGVIRDKEHMQKILDSGQADCGVYELVPVSLVEVSEVVTTTRKVLP
jgi:hypothetical protein